MRGIHRSPVDSPHKGPVMWSFDVFFFFFTASLNTLLNNQLGCQWYEMPWCSWDIRVMMPTADITASNFTEICSSGHNWVSISSGNSLVLNRWHALTWTNDDQIPLWHTAWNPLMHCIYASPGACFNIKILSYQYRTSHNCLIFIMGFLTLSIPYSDCTGRMTELLPRVKSKVLCLM